MWEDLFMSEFIQVSLQPVKQVYNSVQKKQERIGKLVLLHADQSELIENAYAGEIVAVVGIKEQQQEILFVIRLIQLFLNQLISPSQLFHLPLSQQPRSDQEKMGLGS